MASSAPAIRAGRESGLGDDGTAAGAGAASGAVAAGLAAVGAGGVASTFAPHSPQNLSSGPSGALHFGQAVNYVDFQ